MKTYSELKDLLHDELKEIIKKGDITAVDLENIYKVVDVIKDVGEIEQMESPKMSMRGGYQSNANYRDNGYNSYDNSYRHEQMTRDNRYMRNSYDGSYDGNSYNNTYDGNSYEIWGNSRDGSYDASNRYSRHGEKERMIENLHQMMATAQNENEKQAIRQCIERLEK